MKKIILFFFVTSACSAYAQTPVDDHRTSFSSKKAYPNVCDSLTGIIQSKKSQSATALCTTIANALSAYVVNAGEVFSVQKLSDTTLIASGIYKIRKGSQLRFNSIYGPHSIFQKADGFISYKLFVQCKQDAFKYEYTSLNHYGCRVTYGRLCETPGDDNGSRGLKLQFQERTEDQIDLMRKSVSLSDW